MYHDKIVQLITHKESLVALTQDGKIYAWENKKWIEMPLPVKKKYKSKNCQECGFTLPNHAPWHQEVLNKK